MLKPMMAGAIRLHSLGPFVSVPVFAQHTGLPRQRGMEALDEMTARDRRLAQEFGALVRSAGCWYLRCYRGVSSSQSPRGVFSLDLAFDSAPGNHAAPPAMRSAAPMRFAHAACVGPSPRAMSLSTIEPRQCPKRP